MCCAFQVLTEVSKSEIAVLRTFQALAAGIFSRPEGVSDTHARHINLCNNCLSSITGHQSFNVKDFTDDDLDSDGAKTSAVSVGQTPSLVRGLRDFAGLSLEDKQVVHGEDDAVSVMSRDTGSRASSEASFADVSSVESGRRGRDGYELASRTFKKTRKPVARGIEIYSDSDDEIEKAHKTDALKKDTKGSVKPRSGTGVRFNVQEPVVVNTQGEVPKAKIARSETKNSLNSGHTLASSVTIPLGDEGEPINNVVVLMLS